MCLAAFSSTRKKYFRGWESLEALGHLFCFLFTYFTSLDFTSLSLLFTLSLLQFRFYCFTFALVLIKTYFNFILALLELYFTFLYCTPYYFSLLSPLLLLLVYCTLLQLFFYFTVLYFILPFFTIAFLLLYFKILCNFLLAFCLTLLCFILLYFTKFASVTLLNCSSIYFFHFTSLDLIFFFYSTILYFT